MWKCSFVLVACLAVPWLTAAASVQEYSINEPSSTDDMTRGARSAENPLIFNSSEIEVNPGDPLHLDCGVRGEKDQCRWEKEDGEIFQVSDVYDNIYSIIRKPEDTHNNECGIVINSAANEHHGKWTCTVTMARKSFSDSKLVVVRIKPTNPVLEIDNQRDFVVNTEEEKNVVCSVAEARPAVELHWYLDDEDITASSENEKTLANKDIYKTVSTLTRKFLPEDNGKTLMCTISHKTLSTPANVSVSVTVEFKPVQKEVTIFYGIELESDYEIKLNFSANPEPSRKVWRHGEDLENLEGFIDIPAVNGRYTTDFKSLGKDEYAVTLFILNLTQADVRKNYLLEVENKIGQTQYKVRFSMDDAPQDTLSGGAIAGIIIGILVMVVVALAVGCYSFMHKTGKHLSF